MEFKNLFTKVYKKALNTVFLPVCPWCGKPNKKNYICDKCKKAQSGLELGILLPIDLKLMHIRFLNAGYACYKYKPPISTYIKTMKFAPQEYRAHGYAKQVSQLCGNLIAQGERFNFIVPVPATKQEELLRGFNVAKIFAAYTANKNSIEYLNDLLLKCFSTPPQHTLNKMRRAANLVGSMRVNKKYNIKDKNILIIDDIVTTGNTLDECAKLLKIYGAAKVTAISLAAVEINK